MTTKFATVATGLAALLAMSVPATAQVTVGQTIEVLGMTFEVVSFQVRTLDANGYLYEIRFPTEVLEDESESWNTLYASLMVYRSEDPLVSTFCGGETEDRAGDFPLYSSSGGLPSYGMFQESTVSGLAETTTNSLHFTPILSAAIDINGTCVASWLRIDGRYTEAGSRGVHDMAGDKAPTAAELLSYNTELRKLLDYFDVRRVR